MVICPGIFFTTHLLLAGPFLCFFGDEIGLISKGAVSKAKALIRDAMQSALADDAAFDRWFGAHVTRCVKARNIAKYLN